MGCKLLIAPWIFLALSKFLRFALRPVIPERAVIINAQGISCPMGLDPRIPFRRVPPSLVLVIVCVRVWWLLIRPPP